MKHNITIIPSQSVLFVSCTCGWLVRFADAVSYQTLSDEAASHLLGHKPAKGRLVPIDSRRATKASPDGFLCWRSAKGIHFVGCVFCNSHARQMNPADIPEWWNSHRELDSHADKIAAAAFLADWDDDLAYAEEAQSMMLDGLDEE